MQINDINYERKYAYAEIDSIISYLGKDYKDKIPPKFIRIIEREKKPGYKTNFDFSKPLASQVERQETRNILAYLYINYWCKDEKIKQKIILQIEKNEAEKEEQDRINRKIEIEQKAKMHSQSIDDALKARFNN